MSRIGTAAQAVAFALLIREKTIVSTFLEMWNGDEYANIAASAMVAPYCGEMMTFAMYCEMQKDWFGKFDDQMIRDAADEAYSDGEGRFSVPSFMRELDRNGLCIVGKGYNDPDFVKRLVDAYNDHETIPSALLAADLTLMPVERDRGDGRMAHYGDKEQPWDTCLHLGWAQFGAAFSILRYLRRSKQPERDLKHAKVYYGWLRELAQTERAERVKEGVRYDRSLEVFQVLLEYVLTEEERVKLGVTEEDKKL